VVKIPTDPSAYWSSEVQLDLAGKTFDHWSNLIGTFQTTFDRWSNWFAAVSEIILFCWSEKVSTQGP
jgi:hypothetical protein